MSNTQIHLIGGGLGAGKTTQLEGIIENTSWTDGNGLIVMDAAGAIDYGRLADIATSKGFSAENATGACTICDGPEQALPQLARMVEAGSPHVIVELSGRMPLPLMAQRTMRHVAEHGLEADIATGAYLVDPRAFDRLNAISEVPFAGMVGFTQIEPDEALLARVRTESPDASILTLPLSHGLTLEDFMNPMPGNIGAFTRGSHAHAQNGRVPQAYFEVLNPYEDTEQAIGLIEDVRKAFNIDRVKGHIARDAKRLLRIDATPEHQTYQLTEDTDANNGTLLFVKQAGTFAFDSIEEALSPLIMADVKPIVRIHSSRDVFEDYIRAAFEARQPDDAMGAAEQYEHERGSDELIQFVAHSYTQQKLDHLPSDPVRRALQVMPVLYLIDTHHPNLGSDLDQRVRTAARQYLDDLRSFPNTPGEHHVGANTVTISPDNHAYVMRMGGVAASLSSE